MSRRRVKPAIASADDATLICRGYWHHLGHAPSTLIVRSSEEYHVCTILDASFRPLAGIGTRTSANARQEIVVAGPDAASAIPHDVPHVVSPSNLVLFLVHVVTYGRESDALSRLPFALEDGRARSVLEFGGGIHVSDVVHEVDEMPPDTYLARAAELLGENIESASLADIESAVRASRARIASADRDSRLARGWGMLHRRTSREVCPAERAAALRAGYVSAVPLDVLEIATRCDASGRPLEGSRRYVMHFERWNEPPAHSSWFLHVAPSSSDQVELTRGETGTTIELSPIAPGGAHRNWVATQPGEFEVRLILCWPSERALSEMWTPPDIVPV